MMIRLAVLLIVLGHSTKCQSLKLDAHASEITFTIANLGIDVEGHFSDINGTVIFSFEKPETSFFEIQIPAKTIDTGIALRDKHLKNETYFNIEKHPGISFVSKHVRQLKDGSFEVRGLLSIKKTTKEILLPFRVSKMKDMFRFIGSFTINRRDFDVGKNSLTMSDYVNIQVNVIAAETSL